MTWFLLALLGALFEAVYYALAKNFQKKTHYLVLSSGAFLICAFILYVVSVFFGVPPLGPKLYYAVFMTTGLNLMGIMLYYRALRVSDLSLIIPMLSLTPVILTLSSWIILGELPTRAGIIGIFLIAVGLIYIQVKSSRKTEQFFLHGLFVDAGTRYMLVAAVLFGINSSYDKLVVQESNAYFGSAFVSLLLGTIFTIAYLWWTERRAIYMYKQNLLNLFVLGVVLAVGIISINFAFTLKHAAYVLAIKKLSILFTMFIAKLYFQEKHLQKRIIGAVIIFIGIVMLLIY